MLSVIAGIIMQLLNEARCLIRRRDRRAYNFLAPYLSLMRDPSSWEINRRLMMKFRPMSAEDIVRLSVACWVAQPGWQPDAGLHRPSEARWLTAGRCSSLVTPLSEGVRPLVGGGWQQVERMRARYRSTRRSGPSWWRVRGSHWPRC